LFGSKSLPKALDRVKAYATAHPDAGTETQWLRGVGWDQAAFGRMPTAVRNFLTAFQASEIAYIETA
jgi:hypothetical protein